MKALRIDMKPYRLVLGLAVLTVGVYLPVADFGFVNFDDDVYVTGNARVLSGLTAENILWAFQSTEAGFWQPLTWISLMLDFELYGLNAGGYHLTNLILHLGAVGLLFQSLFSLTKAAGRSAFVAVLFALHPLHVESVAWIAERKDVLCGFFWMTSLYAYVRYAARPGGMAYCFLMASFCLGLMSKAMIVTLPFVFLLLDYWPLRRLPADCCDRGGVFPPSGVRRLVWEKLPLVLMAVALTIVTFYAEEQTGALKDFMHYPLAVRISNALISYVIYLWKMIWPAGLAIYYPHPGRVLFWPAVFSGMFLMAVTFLSIRLRGPAPYNLTGWGWYVITLLPVIGLVQIGGHGWADRYAYLPLIGPFMMVAWGGWDLTAAWRFRREAVLVAVAVVIVAMFVAASQQLRYWSDSIALFRRSLAVTEDHYLSRYNLGLALKEVGRWPEAEEQFRRALALQPHSPAAANNLGVVLTMQGKEKEAMGAYRHALELDPNHAGAHNNLGVLLYRQGMVAEAAEHFQAAVRIRNDYANSHYYLGLSLRRLGREKEALIHIGRAVAINPAYAKQPQRPGEER